LEMAVNAQVRELRKDKVPRYGIRAAVAVLQAAAAGMARLWTVQWHGEFGAAAHRCVMTLLLCNARLNGDGAPRLPIEVWLLILEGLRGWHMGQSVLQ